MATSQLNLNINAQATLVHQVEIAICRQSQGHAAQADANGRDCPHLRSPVMADLT